MGIINELLLCFLPSRDAFAFMWLLAIIGILAAYVTIERWVSVGKRTDYDAPSFFEKIKSLLEAKKFDEAYRICVTGGHRAIPRIFASGIRKAQTDPLLVPAAMAEESIHAAAKLENRLNYMVMFSNVATLFGLLGTVFGLIMSFTAVSQPNVAASEKSALLAAGISTAMNSTLVGLSVSVLCVMAYAVLRNRVDTALSEIDRYAVAIMNFLNPPDIQSKKLTSLTRNRSGNESEAADADVTPMLNLMVILIPVLLTSSEFVKMGQIELKLPESSQSAGGGEGGGTVTEQVETKLDLGIVITEKGFNVFSNLRSLPEGQTLKDLPPDVPLVDGKYDYATLTKELANVKKQVLVAMLQSVQSPADASAPIDRLYEEYVALKNSIPSTLYPDNETIKIVAEEKTKYEVVVEVMDASRGVTSGAGMVTLFPNVSIAGGVVQ